jgi:hypothetical protein
LKDLFSFIEQLHGRVVRQSLLNDLVNPEAVVRDFDTAPIDRNLLLHGVDFTISGV